MAIRLSPPDTELNTELGEFLATDECAKKPLASLRVLTFGNVSVLDPEFLQWKNQDSRSTWIYQGICHWNGGFRQSTAAAALFHFPDGQRRSSSQLTAEEDDVSADSGS